MPRTPTHHLLQLARYPVAGFPCWVLLAGLLFLALVDWLTGGRHQVLNIAAN